MVVVEVSVAVLQVTVLTFFLPLAIVTSIFIRLSLLLVAPLVLNDVLSGEISNNQNKQKQPSNVHCYCYCKCFKVDGGAIESGGSYVAWQEFDDHAQDEPGPEDVQSLQQKH